MYFATPDQVVSKLVEAINSEDLSSAVLLYEDCAAFAAQPTEIVIGADGIRDALSLMISMKPKLKTLSAKTVDVGGIALYQSNWEMRFLDVHGKERAQTGCSADVLRFHPEFGWRILIDNPWGSALVNG